MLKRALMIIVIILSCCLITPSELLAYDGPVGVTFRAPFIRESDAIRLEQIQITAKVRIDKNWSLKVDGKNRAFPNGFLATVAESELIFILDNKSNRNVTTDILLPFDASSTPGTGFIQPLSISVYLDDRKLRISNGPTYSYGIYEIRSYRIPLNIPMRSKATLKVEASHPLAMNPAWFRFVCTDSSLKFMNFQNMARHGCELNFELKTVDSDLQNSTLTLKWKKIRSDEWESLQKQGEVRFKGQEVAEIRVDRIKGL